MTDHATRLLDGRVNRNRSSFVHKRARIIHTFLPFFPSFLPMLSFRFCDFDRSRCSAVEVATSHRTARFHMQYGLRCTRRAAPWKLGDTVPGYCTTALTQRSSQACGEHKIGLLPPPCPTRAWQGSAHGTTHSTTSAMSATPLHVPASMSH